MKSDSSDLVAFSGGETILFVEDVDDLCEMASEALRSLGYKVYTASNGLDAIKLFKEKSGEIDLVVTDLIMPGMNGTDLVKQLREQAPDLRVLYTSGYSESHFNHDGFLKKDILFLKKPYSIAQLSSKIQEALKK